MKNVSVCVFVLKEQDDAWSGTSFHMTEKASKHVWQWKKCAQLISAQTHTHTHSSDGSQTLSHFLQTHTHTHYSHTVSLSHIKPCCIVRVVARRQIPNLLKQRDLLLISKPVCRERKGRVKERGKEGWGWGMGALRDKKASLPRTKAFALSRKKSTDSSVSCFDINSASQKILQGMAIRIHSIVGAKWLCSTILHLFKMKLFLRRNMRVTAAAKKTFRIHRRKCNWGLLYFGIHVSG